MTDESKRANIRAEVARGEESLRAARVCAAAGLYADAVSRAYYAAFHHARALILMDGIEAKTHAGVERLLHRDFVRAGRFDPDIARLLSRLMKFRQDADYAAEFVFTDTAAREELDAAERFVAAVLDRLRADGWLT